MNKKIKLTTIVLLILMCINITCYAEPTNNNQTYIDRGINDFVKNEENLSNNNTKYQLIIEDDADLLSSSEEQALEETMVKLTEYGNIIFKSINVNSTTTAKYTQNYYNGKFGKQSGTVFLIDMKKRNIYIFSNGENYNSITNSKAETITDNIYTYATDKEYYECAKRAFEQIYTVLEGGKIAEPMKYISNVVLSVMIALLVNFIIFKIATKNKVATNKEQIDECERFFEHTEPKVSKAGTHKVYSPVQSSSSGGGRRRRSEAAGGGGHSF